MITETHIRNLQNPTKFVKIAKNSRNSTITHKSRLLKYKINKSILNQNKCQLTRNKQPPKHTAARRTPESVPSATKRIQNGQSSANHELSSDPLLRKRVRRRRCSADRRLRRSIQTNPVLLLRQQTRPPRSPAKRALSSGIEQCHHQHMEFRVFGGSVEEGTRDAVQFFGDVFPGFGGFDEFLFHGLKVLV